MALTHCIHNCQTPVADATCPVASSVQVHSPVVLHRLSPILSFIASRGTFSMLPCYDVQLRGGGRAMTP